MEILKKFTPCMYVALLTATLHAEQTFAIIKPYAVQHNLAQSILHTIRKEGFEVLAMKKKTLMPAHMYQLYRHKVHKKWFTAYVTAMTMSPAILLILEKENAVQDWDALKMKIRKHYQTLSKKNNVVHGSDTVHDAQREIAIFFSEEELQAITE